MNEVKMIQRQELKESVVGSIWTDGEGVFYILTLAMDKYCLASLNDGSTWNGMYDSLNGLLEGVPLEMVPTGTQIEIVVGE